MKVTVGVVTYNHEKFIRRALESIVNQETVEFDIEVLIFDDCSTDATMSICKEFSDRYLFVKLLPSERNLGIVENGPRMLAHCKGDFICFCDGDDYWTDNRKLMKQVKVFQENVNVDAVYHNVQILRDNRLAENIYDENQKKFIDFKDLMSGYFMKTCALMMRNRNDLFKSLILKELPGDDTSLCFLALEDGGLGYYIDEVMAVYRIHEKGVWSKISSEQKLIWTEINFMKYIHYYQSKFDVSPLKKQLRKVRRDIVVLYLKNLEFRKAIFWARNLWASN
jgi:glycosyltransferase involved in cell wall biosynthesis